MVCNILQDVGGGSSGAIEGLVLSSEKRKYV